MSKPSTVSAAPAPFASPQRATKLSELLIQLDDAVRLVETREAELDAAATAHDLAQTAYQTAHDAANTLRTQMQTEIGAILPPSRVRIAAGG